MERTSPKVDPSPASSSVGTAGTPTNFIRAKIDEDLRTNKYLGQVVTRFPPEPNGYLHIGHAKSICLNFGIARDYAGARCHLRMDDTNPTTEDLEFVASIQNDVRWLGFDWGEHLYFASDYFEKLYAYAEQLIESGQAYVDSSSEEEIRQRRGTLAEPGVASPYRQRSVADNLDLFRRMRAGEFADGAHVLRGKGDMAADNMKMRDPILYRIRHAHHYRTGDKWCLYPLYDYAHCISDAMEGVTHSICTLEFENNRDIYNWTLRALGFERPPEQTEFARLNLTGTVMSKRKLLELVRERHVDGWDDPRLPTIAGMRRRGFTPAAIRSFCDRIGVAKANSTVDMELLEFCVRDDLHALAPRVMAVQDPIRLVVVDYPVDKVEWIDAAYWPQELGQTGTRPVPFCRELYIEADDFQQEPVPGYFRLAPGAEVRLRHAYLVRCVDVIKDPVSGAVKEIHCTHDPESLGKAPADGRKVKGTIHWVGARHALDGELRLYERLLLDTDEVAADADLGARLNRNSLRVITNAKLEPSLGQASAGRHYQFERLGYFFGDPVDHATNRLVFNRTVTLRDTWSKQTKATETPAKSTGVPTQAQGSTTPKTASNDERARPVKASKTAIKHKLLAKSPEAQALAEELVNTAELDTDDAELLAIDETLASLFRQAKAAGGPAPALARWLLNDVQRELREQQPTTVHLTGMALVELIDLLNAQRITTPIAKEVLAELVRVGGSPAAIVQAKGLAPLRDATAIAALVAEVLHEHPSQVAAFRSGQDKLFGFFVGQVMKASRGRAEPAALQQALREQLGGSR